MDRHEGKSILRSGVKRKALLLTSMLMLMVIAVQLALAMLFLNSAFNRSIDSVRERFDTNIKTACETLVGALAENHALRVHGSISEEVEMEMAREIVRDTRYSSGIPGQVDDGYFWADMADGTCAVHYNPANEGQMRWDWIDQEGNNYIRTFIRLGDEGGGYSEFYFGKPGDEQGSYKKRGYTLKYEPYGWYISTGNYFEDTDKAIADMAQANRSSVIVLVVASVATAAIGIYLVSKNLNRVVEPLIRISARMRRLSQGDTTPGPFAVTDNDEIGDLHESVRTVIGTIDSLLHGIKTMIAEHEKGNIDYSFDTGEFLGDYKELAENVLELAAFGMQDQLTGLPNRRSFANRIDMEWKRAMREKSAISVAMIDIDEFKGYNDLHGHQQGDVTLAVVARTIKDAVKRSTDFVARWGGEEFVALLPLTDAEGALHIAEKIRRDVENAVLPCDSENGRKATVSIGLHTVIPEPDMSIDDFVSLADAALYQAKETGRNQVRRHQEEA